VIGRLLWQASVLAWTSLSTAYHGSCDEIAREANKQPLVHSSLFPVDFNPANQYSTAAQTPMGRATEFARYAANQHIVKRLPRCQKHRKLSTELPETAR